ncbi:MAG: transcription antitermination factor NusB [Bacteroidota bacterium]
MLSRRYLRIKAMQSLYAFYQSERAEFELGISDLDIPNPKRKAEIGKLLSFDRSKGFIRKNSIDLDIQLQKPEEEALEEFISNLKKGINKDILNLRKQMLKAADKISDHYVWLIELLKELARAEEVFLSKRKEKAAQTGIIKVENKRSLNDNLIIKSLKSTELIESEIIRKSISWEGDFDTVIRWYKDLVFSNDTYQEYLRNADATFETDKSVLLYIVKNIIFKSEPIDDFFSEKILNWEEDRDILKSLLVKSIKDSNSDQEDFELAELSYNLEDDLTYFEEIFDKTIDKENELDEYISEKSRNWDKDRFAILDHIILRMALCEMLHFSSIPVKVTINEYIEISKKYSTPKSRQFINGILDVLSKELKEKGQLRKSGRGLLDNK